MKKTSKGRVHAFEIGKSYLIRTVTNYWTGKVELVLGDFLVLSDAAWIADTGRFSEAKDESHLREVEPVDGEAIVGLSAVVDARPWTTDLPRSVK